MTERLKTPQVAKILGTSESRVEELVDKGELVAHHRSFFPDFTLSSFRMNDVLAYVARTCGAREATGA